VTTCSLIVDALVREVGEEGGEGREDLYVRIL